ncbi:MAG: BLUF domain-containing protein [Pseudomonadota bacterium]
MLDFSEWKSFQILYVSTHTRVLSDVDLTSLKRVVQKRNQTLGLHGFLYCANGRFCQFLEGSEPTVLWLMERIVRDPRHRDVRVLAEEQTAFPLFSSFHAGMCLGGSRCRMDDARFERVIDITADRVRKRRLRDA